MTDTFVIAGCAEHDIELRLGRRALELDVPLDALAPAEQSTS